MDSLLYARQVHTVLYYAVHRKWRDRRSSILSLADQSRLLHIAPASNSVWCSPSPDESTQPLRPYAVLWQYLSWAVGMRRGGAPASTCQRGLDVPREDTFVSIHICRPSLWLCPTLEVVVDDSHTSSSCQCLCHVLATDTRWH